MDPVHGVLEILDRASMTGTNKLGLLLALLDLAPTLDWWGTHSISRNALAEKHLEIHWEHARPYQGHTLRQSSSKKPRTDGSVADDTTVMQEIHSLRELLRKQRRGDLQDKPLHIVRHSVESSRNPEWQEAYETALVRVQAALLKNPVRLLQELPGKPQPFLYEWHAEGLTLLPGVAESLTKFAGVLRPLIEFKFASAVMKINREGLLAPIDDVYTHLFGRDRIMPPMEMREDLVEIQQGRCVLSGDSLPPRGVSLDHVMPWSRVPLSQIENFLITSGNVNSSKSDSLLAPVVIERWLHHQETNHKAIQQCAQEHHWPTDIEAIRRVMRHTYGALDATTAVWDPETGLHALGESGKREVLELLR